VALLLLVFALALAVQGQLYFFRRREYLWDGVVFHGLAVLCFGLAWRLGLPRKPRAARRRSSSLTAWLREQRAPSILAGIALFFSFIATLLARFRGLSDSTTDAVAFWILGVAAILGTAFWPTAGLPGAFRGRRPRLHEGLRTHWPEITAVLGLTVLALVLRVSALDSVPYTLGGDEAWHGLLARQVLSGELRNPFFMGRMSMPTLFYWPLSWSLWLAGNDMTGLRLPAALVGAVTVPALYLLTRRLWGRRSALVAASFLAAYDYHIHYSRLGANNVWDPLFVVVTLWFVDRGLVGGQTGSDGERRRQSRAFILAGAVMGLSYYFYTGARLLPVLVAVYVAFVWVKGWAAGRAGMRSRPSSGGRGAVDGANAEAATGTPRLGLNLALLILAFLVVAGPMLGYRLAHSAEWNARLNQVGIIQSGWLEREPGLTGKSTPTILAEQFLRSVGAFHVFADRTVWYGATRPLLGFLAGVFAMLGMAWAVFHWRDRRYFLVLLWFWSVIVTGGMLTESPPSSQRLVMAIPAVAWLVMVGLRQVTGLVRAYLDPRQRHWESLALFFLVLVLGVVSVRFYFMEFQPTRRYGSENGETATMIGHYLRELECDYGGCRAYFFGAPRIYWSFGTMAFIAPGVPGQDVLEPLNAPPDFVDEGRAAVFVSLAERAGELEWVRDAFPGGQWQQFYDAQDRLRFAAYEVQP
jgi:hypothetical protein